MRGTRPVLGMPVSGASLAPVLGSDRATHDPGDDYSVTLHVLLGAWQRAATSSPLPIRFRGAPPHVSRTMIMAVGENAQPLLDGRDGEIVMRGGHCSHHLHLTAPTFAASLAAVDRQVRGIVAVGDGSVHRFEALVGTSGDLLDDFAELDEVGTGDVATIVCEPPVLDIAVALELRDIRTQHGVRFGEAAAAGALPSGLWHPRLTGKSDLSVGARPADLLSAEPRS